MRRSHASLRQFLFGVLVLAVAGAAWAECVTGDLTPEQQTCCLAMDHDCGAAGMEMSCCRTEVPQLDSARVIASKSFLLAPALVSGPAAPLPQPRANLNALALVSFDLALFKLPDRPRHLFLSVFLI